MATAQVLYRSPRDDLGSTLVLALIFSFGWLFLTPFIGARATAIGIPVLVAALLYLRWLVGFRVTSYGPQSGDLVIEWRDFLFRMRREVFAARRFESVASFRLLDKRPRTLVYLLEQSGKTGVLIASFDVNYQYRSFWDLSPRINEATGAQELRMRLSAILRLRDEGFVEMGDRPEASR